jgi:hypothetical protein
VDLELKDELALIKKFERLNDEKITPYFLKLAKTPESGSTLSEIKNNDDQIFENQKERHSYMTGFYRDLYKKPRNEQHPNVTIEDFLGDVALIPKLFYPN